MDWARYLLPPCWCVKLETFIVFLCTQREMFIPQFDPLSCWWFFYVKQRPPLCPLCAEVESASLQQLCWVTVVTACHSSPLPLRLHQLLGFIGSVTSSENLGSWWFLLWSQLCVWLTLMMESPIWQEVGRRTNTMLTWAVWKSYFLLKHISIALKIFSVGNSRMPFWTPET